MAERVIRNVSHRAVRRDDAGRRRRWRRSVLGVGTLAAVGIATVLAAPPASAAPAYKVPFPCGQSWSGQTRSYHSPVNAVDFNRGGDSGDAVVASAPGRVVTVRNLGPASYGRYVVVDHGSGATTLYAHLSSVSVSVGERVGYGERIGSVGSTGNSSGAHLHYEQRSGGRAVRVKFNGSTALYFGTRTYRSDNGCGGGGGSNATVDTAGARLNVRSGPGTGHRVVDTISDGSRVRIQCQATGTRVAGRLGSSRIWNKIGNDRFVSDAYVQTGTDGFIRGVPRC